MRSSTLLLVSAVLASLIYSQKSLKDVESHSKSLIITNSHLELTQLQMVNIV